MLSYESGQVLLNDDITITDAYRSINSEEYDKNSKALYVNYARVGVKDDYYGMGWLIWWYQRNLIIFANLTELASKGEEEERILLLIGAAHKGILTELLSDSALFEVVNTLEYL